MKVGNGRSTQGWAPMQEVPDRSREDFFTLCPLAFWFRSRQHHTGDLCVSPPPHPCVMPTATPNGVHSAAIINDSVSCLDVYARVTLLVSPTNQCGIIAVSSTTHNLNYLLSFLHLILSVKTLICFEPNMWRGPTDILYGFVATNSPNMRRLLARVTSIIRMTVKYLLPVERNKVVGCQQVGGRGQVGEAAYQEREK